MSSVSRTPERGGHGRAGDQRSGLRSRRVAVTADLGSLARLARLHLEGQGWEPRAPVCQSSAGLAISKIPVQGRYLVSFFLFLPTSPRPSPDCAVPCPGRAVPCPGRIGPTAFFWSGSSSRRPKPYVETAAFPGRLLGLRVQRGRAKPSEAQPRCVNSASPAAHEGRGRRAPEARLRGSGTLWSPVWAPVLPRPFVSRAAVSEHGPGAAWASVCPPENRDNSDRFVGVF